MTVKILGVHLIVVNNITYSDDFKGDNSDREELLCKPWEFDECFDANAEVQIGHKTYEKSSAEKRNSDLTGHLQEKSNLSKDDFFLAWRRLGGDVL